MEKCKTVIFRHRGEAKWENSFIMQKENRLTKDCMVWSNSQVKEGRWETGFYREKCQRKPGLHPGLCFKKYHTLKNYK